MTEPLMPSLGRYTIHTELGRGGFTTVYRATDAMLERKVASLLSSICRPD